MNFFITTAYAEAANGAAAGGSMAFSGLLLPVLMLVILYFLMIRPQRKRDKLVKEMLAALMVGDKIITIGGINGKIVSLKDDTLVIETGSGQEKSNITVSRWAVREVVKPAEA